MNLQYLCLLITLKNIDCYNPKQRTQTSSSSNFKNLKSKTSDLVIPARYKITSKANYEDPTITQSFPAEYFPEVEYPESVVDSSKPFYLSASPFPNDVKSSFNSLVAQGNSKEKATTDYSWIHNENNNEKDVATSQKIDMNDITVTKENEINFNEKNTNETLKDITTLDEDKTANDKITYSENDMDRLLTNWSSTEQSAKCQDEDYFVGFIHDLDEVMKNLTNTETTGPDESNISAMNTFESECSDEVKLMNSDTEPSKNDSIIEFNGNSFDTEQHPERIWSLLFDDSDTNEALTSLTSVFNAYLTNISTVEDMQSDFCSIGTISNESNTSCADS